ncbi:DMT family transporter [Sinirhodobacter huangdaonensis]|uniref:DMT family transporter n=1 Tax=Paenirhodobacter huangdaonensis TaxID=2501515 RepID=UPI001EF1360D|nr:DMT family transporter [Sinirhodobacter huangdaonensis]
MLFLLGSLATFTLMDAVAKYLVTRYHPAQLIWARFAINLALVALVYRGSFLPRLRTRQPLAQAARGVMQVITIVLFFVAIRHIGLAEADALFDINPILITLGAALFLGERIGPRRIAGIVIAFLGALVILRPGVGAFEPAAALAFASAFSYAAGNLLTRVVRTDPLATSLIWSALVGTVLSSIALPFVWKEVAIADFPIFLALGVLGSAGQALVVRAFSLSEASTLAPFGYFSLIFASLWGFLFFGQLPDVWTVAGALVIVGAGLYVWYRERKSAE